MLVRLLVKTILLEGKIKAILFLLLFFSGGLLYGADAAEAVRVAAADAAKLDAQVLLTTRYISAHHLAKEELDSAYVVTSYHVNLLSRKGIIKRPRKVNDWLWCIDIDDYGWARPRFGQLVFSKFALEPYFHVQVLDGKGGKVVSHAPWLPANEIVYLSTVCDSMVPIVRYDWFINRTAMQEGRDGFGYYDFLEFKSRADAEKLAGLDRKAAEKLFREQAAVIDESGVALQSRQIFRYATISGSWWETRDTNGDDNSKDAKNPIRKLLDDYKHDAEEIVFTLPNRLPGYYLSNAVGKGVASAPPDIASDGKSVNNDRRVHACLSCVRCHVSNGLINFDDLFRDQFAFGEGLNIKSPDKDFINRLNSVYLGKIKKDYKMDVENYGDAIKDASGLDAEAARLAYVKSWSVYIDEGITVSRAAREVGLEEKDFILKLKNYARVNKVVDPVLSKYLKKEPGVIRREHFEEAFSLLMLTLGGSDVK